ncbi:MAG: hypothetical protein ACREDK_09315, partial [Thermoplasmata archaeon]
HGGPIEFVTPPEFRTAWEAGGVHPMDLKAAVAEAVERIVAPANAYFARHADADPAAFEATGESHP